LLVARCWVEVIGSAFSVVALQIKKIVSVSCFETDSPEIPPGLPFPKGGEGIHENSVNRSTFSPFEKGGLKVGLT
jgi:hypothetical protein